MSRPDYVPDDAAAITNHGATPNPDDDDVGIADANRQAIINAADASDGANVYVPEGTYYYTREGSGPYIRVGDDCVPGLSVYGDGGDRSTLAVSEHSNMSRHMTMFEYEDYDHGSFRFEGVRLDGNAENLDSAGDAIDLQSGARGHLTLEGVHLYNMYMRGIRSRGSTKVDITARRTTFERIALGRTKSTGGDSITHGVEWNSDDGTETAIFDRCHFKTISGNAVDDRDDPTTDITFTDCYVEGVGTGILKLTGADVTIRNTYIQPYSRELDEEVGEYTYDGRCAFYAHDGSPEGVELTDVEIRGTTEFGLGARNGNALNLSGDAVAFHDVGFRREDRGVFWARTDDETFSFDSFGSVSADGVSDGDEPVFQTESATGSIESVRWSDSDGLGNTGDITIDETLNGADSIEPDVPSSDEVGYGAPRTDDGDEEMSASDGDVDSPLFDDWSPQWDSSSDDWSVVSDDAFAGEHALAFENDDGLRGRFALSCDRVGDPADVEVLDRFRVPEFSPDDGLGFHARVHLRSGTRFGGGEDGYWLEIEDREDAFRLAKYTDGGLTTLARFGTPVEGEFLYRRFRAEGDEIKAKVWQVGEDEPADWDVEVTDADHSDGWVGLGSFDPELVETDVFSVATGGDTAQIPETTSVDVETVDATDVGEESATLVGEVHGLDTLDAGVGYFEYRESGTDAWTTSDELTVDELDEFRVAVTGLDAGTEYEFRAVLDADDVTTGEVLTFATEAVGDDADSEGDETEDDLDDDGGNPSALVVEQFEVTDESDSTWTRYDVDWIVADADADLDTVVTKLRSDGATVAAKSTGVTGDRASYTHVLRVRGDVDEVVLTANDTENRTVSETTSV